MDLEEIKSYISYKQNNSINGIPLKFNKFKDVLPNIEKTQFTIITSGVGDGKTSLAFDKWVLDPIEFILTHPQIDAHWDYFSIEEPKLAIDLKLTSRFFKMKQGLEFSTKELMNVYNDGRFKQHLHKLDSLKPLIDLFNERVKVIEDAHTPKHIEQKIQHFIETNKHKIHNPDFYYIVVIDNLASLDTSGYSTLKECIDDLCKNILNKYKKSHLIIPVVIQHQNADSEQVHYNQKGEINLHKIKPTLSGLDGSTATQKFATDVVALTNPFKFGVKKYFNWNIEAWGDKIRFLSMLKARGGGNQMMIPMYFNGKIGEYQEIIHTPEEFESTPNLYTKYNISYSLNQTQASSVSSKYKQQSIEL